MKQSDTVLSGSTAFGTERVLSLLLRLAPPVMAAQLIQALYNVVDSYYIGRYDGRGLAALSVIFPLQLLISALAIGTGVGVNTRMAAHYGRGESREAEECAGTGLALAIILWAAFALLSAALLRPYTAASLTSPRSRAFALTYGRIVCVLSLGIFLESCWTKILQAQGDMKTPMIAQITGALTNIVLDRLLIFGAGPFPELGVAGAAIASVIGQFLAAAIVGRRALHLPPEWPAARQCLPKICRSGAPSALMNASCTVYIVALNLILVRFSDEAVTILGLYYKLQSFLLIPVMGLCTCIVPLLSYNYAAGKRERCRFLVRDCLLLCALFLAAGTLVFELLPGALLHLFTDDAAILEGGATALRIIALSFVPIALTVILPTSFQALGRIWQSNALALLRQIGLLIPLAWLFSFLGLTWVWAAFPIAELLDALACVLLWRRERPLRERPGQSK